MTPLAAILMDQGAPGRGAPPALRWLADWLPDATQVELSAADIARIDAYAGSAGDLHSLLPAVTPLARPVWIEASVTAAGGTRMTFGYGGLPAGDAIDIGWACWAPAHGRILGPLGPARMTATEMERPAGTSDESWRELRAGAGIVIRAILLGLTPAAGSTR